jgi:hypothetical protein
LDRAKKNSLNQKPANRANSSTGTRSVSSRFSAELASTAAESGRLTGVFMCFAYGLQRDFGTPGRFAQSHAGVKFDLGQTARRSGD